MSDENVVRTPIPGVFYRRPSPGSPPFVSEGDVVEDGGVVGLVEVMKQFHDLVAEEAGTVGSFQVENEGMVDAGQPIVTID